MSDTTDLIRQMADLKLIGNFEKARDSKYSATKALSTIFDEMTAWSNQENLNLDEVFAAAKAKIKKDIEDARQKTDMGFGKTTIESSIDTLIELIKQYLALHYGGKWRKMLKDQFKIQNAYWYYIQQRKPKTEDPDAADAVK